MQKTIALLFAMFAVGCAPVVMEPAGSPCEPLRPAYADALQSLRDGGLPCADAFEAAGCFWTDVPAAAQVEACEELIRTHATSCAALQNAVWDCQGGL